jgi:hypothetical protein
MWQKTKEQVPAIIITAAILIAAASFMVRNVLKQQQAELAPLRAQNEMLRAQGEENRRQIAATNKLLNDALAQNGGMILQPEGQIEKINEQRLTRLAEVIAQRVLPSIPTPKSAAEAEAAQNEQVDKVAGRLAENIRPVLAEAIADQKAAAATLVRSSENRAEQLNLGLLATQAAAQDALKLSREVSAMYVDSVKDHGVLMRLFSLPASLVIDASRGNLVTGDRVKAQQELSAKMEEIEKRLREIQSLAGSSAGSD